MLRRIEVEAQVQVLAAARIIVQRGSGVMTDAEALATPLAFEVWGSGMRYGEGQVISHNGQLYRMMTDVEQSLESQPPDGEGMLAVYRPIEVEHSGTRDDPIPWIYGMDCVSGKYYLYEGAVWYCAGSMIPCTWYPGYPGLWQWEEVTG